jgi:hypothetical protein
MPVIRSHLLVAAIAIASLLGACGGVDFPSGPVNQIATVGISPSAATLTALGQTLSLTAVAKDAQGAVLPDQVFSWASDEVDVATVDEEGLVTAVGNGTAEITAAANDVVGSCSLRVQQAVTAIHVSPATATLPAVGDTVRLTAVAKDGGGNPIPGVTFGWTSSHPEVAEVDSRGLVTATGLGTATITASREDIEGMTTITVGAATKLVWPIDCIPGITCSERIGYPDIDGDGVAFDCGQPGYRNHQGTDINISWSQMDDGVDVLAAAAGQVLWVFDGKYDRCPNPDEPDCRPPQGDLKPGSREGHTVCTDQGSYCGTGECCCFWCFAGGNVVIIRHTDVPGVFATRYDHLKKNSILVTPGEHVAQGQKIAEVGSAGSSTGPHLHFEVWGTGFYQLADPWAGPCGPRLTDPLWAYDPPWEIPGGGAPVPKSGSRP